MKCGWIGPGSLSTKFPEKAPRKVGVWLNPNGLAVTNEVVKKRGVRILGCGNEFKSSRKNLPSLSTIVERGANFSWRQTYPIFVCVGRENSSNCEKFEEGGFEVGEGGGEGTGVVAEDGGGVVVDTLRLGSGLNWPMARGLVFTTSWRASPSPPSLSPETKKCGLSVRESCGAFWFLSSVSVLFSCLFSLCAKISGLRGFESPVIAVVVVSLLVGGGWKGVGVGAIGFATGVKKVSIFFGVCGFACITISIISLFFSGVAASPKLATTLVLGKTMDLETDQSLGMVHGAFEKTGLSVAFSSLACFAFRAR